MASIASAVARATATSGATTTTGSFTPANGALLVACVGSDSALTSVVTHTVSGGSLTWTERIHVDAAAFPSRSGGASIWTATSAGAAMTATAAGGPGAISCQVYAVTGQTASPIGATGTGQTTTASNTASVLTSTAAGSILVVAANDWAETGLATSTDLTLSTFDASGSVSGFAGYKTLGAAGAQTAQFTFPGAPNGLWAALEILDAGTIYLPPRVFVLPGGAVHRAASW